MNSSFQVSTRDTFFRIAKELAEMVAEALSAERQAGLHESGAVKSTWSGVEMRVSLQWLFTFAR